MVISGLWLTLWRTRWRILGLLPVAAGLALAPLLPRPDMLVGRDGALVALRPEADARFVALTKRNSDFELKRWLEADGDPRQARTAVPRINEVGSAFRCDGIGCASTVKKRSVAIVRHPAALRDDCARADILILDIPRPSGCDHPSTVIDFWALRRLGTHAVYLEGDSGVRIETVADHRGDRPWSTLPPLPQPHVIAGRAGQAEPRTSAVPQRELRPEVEDDEEGEGEEPN
jgi:competence protein ComEC